MTSRCRKLTSLRDARKTISIDAVTATVDLPVQTLSNRLAAALGGTVQPCRPLRGMGYSHAAELVHPDTMGRRCVIQYGSAHTKPNVVAEGTESYDAPALYETLCQNFAGKWLPSRLDPALDIHQDDAFDLVSPMLLEFAKSRGVTIDQRGDWERGHGRTLYLYSRESAFYVRLYEYRAHHGYGPPCRLEVEIKLKAKHRERLATLAPWEMLSLCPASQHVLNEIGVELPRLVLTAGPRPPSSVERDKAFLARTAWPALNRMIGHHLGDIEAAVLDVALYREQSAEIRAVLTGRKPFCHTSAESQHYVTPIS